MARRWKKLNGRMEIRSSNFIADEVTLTSNTYSFPILQKKQTLEQILFYTHLTDQLTNVNGDYMVCGFEDVMPYYYVIMLATLEHSSRFIWGYTDLAKAVSPLPTTIKKVRLLAYQAELTDLTMKTRVTTVDGLDAHSLAQYTGNQIALAVLEDATVLPAFQESLLDKMAIGGIISLPMNTQTDPQWEGFRFQHHLGHAYLIKTT